MKTYSLAFTANETKTLQGGRVLFLMTTTDAVDIRLSRHNAALPESAEGVSQGFKARPRVVGGVGFDKAEITSATAQTIAVAISMGDVDANTIGGSIKVSGTVLVRAKGGNEGYYRSSISSALNTIKTPAQNTAGILISSVLLESRGHEVRLMHKTSAPTSWTNGIGIASYLDDAGGGKNRYLSHVALPYLVPAGHGLYEKGLAATYVTGVDLSFEVLS